MTRWTEQQRDFLRAAVALGVPTSMTAQALGRSASAIGNERRRLGIEPPTPTAAQAEQQALAIDGRYTSNNAPHWTTDELATLTENFDAPAEELERLLPKRTRQAIVRKRSDIKAKQEKVHTDAAAADLPLDHIVTAPEDAEDPVRAEQRRRQPQHVPPRPQPAAERRSRRSFLGWLLGE